MSKHYFFVQATVHKSDRFGDTSFSDQRLVYAEHCAEAEEIMEIHWHNESAPVGKYPQFVVTYVNGFETLGI